MCTYNAVMASRVYWVKLRVSHRGPFLAKGDVVGAHVDFGMEAEGWERELHVQVDMSPKTKCPVRASFGSPWEALWQFG